MLDLNSLKDEICERIKKSINLSYTGFNVPRGNNIIINDLDLLVNCVKNDIIEIYVSEFNIIIHNKNYKIDSFTFNYHLIDPYDENVEYLKIFGSIGVKTGHQYASPFMFS